MIRLLKKFVLFVIALFCMACFCACSSNAGNVGMLPLAGQSCSAVVKYGQNEFKARLYVKGGGLFSVEILAPTELGGFVFSFDNEEVNLVFDNLSEKPSGELSGPIKMLNGIFLQLTLGSPMPQCSGGSCFLKGRYDGCNYAVILNAQGLPAALSVPQLGLYAEFLTWQE